MESMSTVAIIQARMASTRLPGKVLLMLGGKRVIDHVYARVSLSAEIDRVVIAITDRAEDDVLFDYCLNNNYDVFRGSESDVLGRFYNCACEYKAATVVRITADCPLIDPVLIDEIVKLHKAGRHDYASNTIEPTFPDGLDVEVFSFSVLKEAVLNATSKYEREHVTPYLKNKLSYDTVNFQNEINFSHLRWTLDEPSDYSFLQTLFSLGLQGLESWTDLLALVMSSENKLWVQDKNCINEPSMLSLAVICCFQRDLKCFFLISGLHILTPPKVVR
jgi:spore coat polysaccharide biosynthesis protein SpsF (cytidylyltransferase family)